LVFVYTTAEKLDVKIFPTLDKKEQKGESWPDRKENVAKAFFKESIIP